MPDPGPIRIPKWIQPFCIAAIAGPLLLISIQNLWPGLIAGIVRRVNPEKDFTGYPLGRVPELRGVAEPITMIRGFSWTDGGSLGIKFIDANHREVSACLANDFLDDGSLWLGYFSSGLGRKVPIGSDDEKAFLGLIQRWQRRDPEARAWQEQIRTRGRIEPRPGSQDDRYSEEQHAKLIALAILNDLIKRN